MEDFINDRILQEIDREIDHLQKARALLAGAGPKAARSVEPIAVNKPPKRKRRKLSLEARKRIAEAQRKRWAKAKSQA